MINPLLFYCDDYVIKATINQRLL